MIKPRIGLLTAIGPMHLERFDNDMKALERSQFELLNVYNAWTWVLSKNLSRTQIK